MCIRDRKVTNLWWNIKKQTMKMAATPVFNIESERRKSFKYWEVTFVSPDELAFVGFYHYPLNYDVCGHSMSVSYTHLDVYKRQDGYSPYTE